MFWKESKGLNNIPGSGKLAVTAVLVLLGLSYIFGFLNIYLTYSPIDKEPGMSITDIQIAFYGAREQTRLEKSIDGTMLEYFADDREYQTVKDWISNQKTSVHNQMNDLLMDIISLKNRLFPGPLTILQQRFVFTALYDLDRFRNLVFETKQIPVEDLESEKLKTARFDDIALMTIGIDRVKIMLRHPN